MMRKIESNVLEVWYDETKLDLYVDWQDPTKFIITDKSVIPLLTFVCDHSSTEEIQNKLNEVMSAALTEWNKLHRTQDQRDRLSGITSDKSINIIIDNTRKYSE